jgi:hypothetical protein
VIVAAVSPQHRTHWIPSRCSRSRWHQLEDGPERVELVVPQPQAAEVYYTACAQIDRHKRSGQADLDLEEKVGSHDWSFRVNCTVLGMSC